MADIKTDLDFEKMNEKELKEFRSQFDANEMGTDFEEAEGTGEVK